MVNTLIMRLLFSKKCGASFLLSRLISARRLFLLNGNIRIEVLKVYLQQNITAKFLSDIAVSQRGSVYVGYQFE